ncbi:hypothetical protein B0H67DRAFT_547990 [Lasiosphaeris hirsuta]|uniref:Stress-response A/B barrel domain-containing protein n=1 Tax=Lasiosphaeris hirsuta TaxID=260670 RepID=A0AA40E6D7_9PEZI|nr:hypothetical protein B0H67DRAFT_547990 [Lasiosphaeris hirsuta]
MASYVNRITMFKVPDPENQRRLLDAYQALANSQQKGGEPYILSAQASLTKGDPRCRGYTVVAQTGFASLDDMKYYDTECPAHAIVKKTAGSLGLSEPPLVVYYEM